MRDPLIDHAWVAIRPSGHREEEGRMDLATVSHTRAECFTKLARLWIEAEKAKVSPGKLDRVVQIQIVELID